MLNDKVPNISVIMPVYNTKEEYLREAIASILRQSYADFELLIVDDCSKKYIEKIISSYSDNRIKYFKLETNQGAARARNYALAHAQGNFIAFMDSDDVSLPDRFAKQMLFFEENPEIGCLGTKVSVIGDACKGMEFPKPTKHEEIENYLIFNGCVFCQSSVMVKKSILDENTIMYQTDYVPAEDYALWLDLVGKTTFAVLDEKLVLYRFYDDNISNKQKELQQQKCIEAQYFALKKYFNLSTLNKEIWVKFVKGLPFSADDLINLNLNVKEIIKSLYAKNYTEKMILSLFERKLKRLFYHSHGISTQWNLLTSPLNKTLRIPLSWRLFCFITRGFF